MVVLTAFISPYAEDRLGVRSLHPVGGFIEVFVDCPLEECERRDVKGLHEKARAGEIAEFSGVSALYEIPLESELTVCPLTSDLTICVGKVLVCLETRGVVPAI